MARGQDTMHPDRTMELNTNRITTGLPKKPSKPLCQGRAKSSVMAEGMVPRTSLW